MSTLNSYAGALNTGSQSGPSINLVCIDWMTPAFATMGPGAIPIPVGQILQTATLGVAYSETITASGGVGPYTFSVVGGALPTGLSMSSGGVISGTPTAVNTFSFTVQAMDSLGSIGSSTFEIIVAGGTNSGYIS